MKMNLKQISREFLANHPDITEATADLTTFCAYRRVAERFGMKGEAAAFALTAGAVVAPYVLGPWGLPLSAAALYGAKRIYCDVHDVIEADGDRQTPFYHLSPHAPDSYFAAATRAELQYVP